MKRNVNTDKFGQRIGIGPTGMRIVPSVQPTPRDVKNAPKRKAKPDAAR